MGFTGVFPAHMGLQLTGALDSCSVFAEETMEKLMLVPCVALLALCLAGCPSEESVSEPLFGYTLELNITNKSSVGRTVLAEAYVLYDEIKQARKLYDCEPVTIPAGETHTYTTRIQDSLCAPPHLSHIIRIGDVVFAGFDTGSFRKETADPTLPEEFSVAGTVPCSVDWTKEGDPVLKTGEESFYINEGLPEVKIICTVDIRDEAGSPESGSDGYTHGIKITPVQPGGN